MMWRRKVFSIYAVSLSLFALPVLAQTTNQSDSATSQNTDKASAIFEIGGANDPFVRGLKRLIHLMLRGKRLKKNSPKRAKK